MAAGSGRLHWAEELKESPGRKTQGKGPEVRRRSFSPEAADGQLGVGWKVEHPLPGCC